MRNAMIKLKPNKFYIFEGTYKGVDGNYKYAVFKNVKIFDGQTQEYKGRINHLLLEQKKFKRSGVTYKDLVKFTGKSYIYIRADGSRDYSVKINKIKEINHKKFL